MSIDSIRYRTILDADDLAHSCERWRASGAIAIDTEFVRERTFYPILGLVQISDGQDHTLVDPLEIENLDPLADLLRDPSITKVLHSCSEDMEVFHHHLGLVPKPIVDTQIAAALAGLGYSLGYGRMVETLCGEVLPKGQTRSNWLRRPLSEAQQRYAALDVAFLLQCYDQLMERLESLGRLPWLQEECERVCREDRFRIDDEAGFRKLARGKRMHRRQLVVLRELFLWREQTARNKNLPRSFVLRDNALNAIAVRRPETFDDLRRISDLQPNDLKRHGKKILQLVAVARSRPVAEHPAAQPPPLDLRPYKEVVRGLRDEVKKLAEAQELPHELLANRRQVESLLRRHLEKEDPVLPAPLRGWRQTVVGDPLVKKMRQLVG